MTEQGCQNDLLKRPSNTLKIFYQMLKILTFHLLMVKEVIQVQAEKICSCYDRNSGGSNKNLFTG
jgi:hypothetical protein